MREAHELLNRAVSLTGTIVRNARGIPDKPRFLTHTVTFRCNARCVMCDSWKKPSFGELTLGEIESIYEQRPHMDVVRLTGGEPFLRHDLLRIARAAQDMLRPLALHVTTNGFLTDRIVAFCERRPQATPLHVLISIDGMEAKHDRTRGRAGAWAKATRTVRELATARSDLRVRLAVNQAILDAEGLDDYERLRDFLEPYGVSNNVVLAYDASATYSSEQEPIVRPPGFGRFVGERRLDTARVQRFIRTVQRDLRVCSPLESVGKRYYVRGLANRLLGGARIPNPRCVALSSHMRLFPDGSVPTCQFNTVRVGNLRDQPFDTMWFGDRAKRQRAWVRRCPGCWAECEVLPNAVYSGALLKELLASALG